jgi:GTPase SAR1 family protein
LKIFNDNRIGEGFAFLIGNKVDLEYREVEQEEGIKRAEELGMSYYEVSAKTGENVEQLFFKVIEVVERNSTAGVNFSLTKKENEVIKEEENAKEEDSEAKQPPEHHPERT